MTCSPCGGATESGTDASGIHEGPPVDVVRAAVVVRAAEQREPSRGKRPGSERRLRGGREHERPHVDLGSGHGDEEEGLAVQADGAGKVVGVVRGEPAVDPATRCLAASRLVRARNSCDCGHRRNGTRCSCPVSRLMLCR